jgi:hypothetical protein
LPDDAVGMMLRVTGEDDFPARIVSLPGSDFLHVLKTKFGLSDR